MEKPTKEEIEYIRETAKVFGIEMDLDKATRMAYDSKAEREFLKRKAKDGTLIKKYEKLFEYVLPDIKSPEDAGIWEFAIVNKKTGKFLEYVKASKSVFSEKEAKELAGNYRFLKNRFSPIGVVGFLEKDGVFLNEIEIKDKETREKYYHQQPLFTIDNKVTTMSSFLDFFWAVDECYKRQGENGIVQLQDISWRFFKNIFDETFGDEDKEELIGKFVRGRLNDFESKVMKRYMADWHGAPLMNTLDDPRDNINLARSWRNGLSEITRDMLQDYYLTCDYIHPISGMDRGVLENCFPQHLFNYRFELENHTGRPDSEIWFNHLFSAFSRVGREVTLAEWWYIQLDLRFLRNIQYYRDVDRFPEYKEIAKEYLEHPSRLYWEVLGTEDLDDEENIFNVMFKYDPYWSKKQ